MSDPAAYELIQDDAVAAKWGHYNISTALRVVQFMVIHHPRQEIKQALTLETHEREALDGLYRCVHGEISARHVHGILDRSTVTSAKYSVLASWREIWMTIPPYERNQYLEETTQAIRPFRAIEYNTVTKVEIVNGTMTIRYIPRIKKADDHSPITLLSAINFAYDYFRSAGFAHLQGQRLSTLELSTLELVRRAVVKCDVLSAIEKNHLAVPHT